MMLAESISAVADKVIEAEALNKFYELFSIFIVDHSLVSDHTYHNHNFISPYSSQYNPASDTEQKKVKTPEEPAEASKSV